MRDTQQGESSPSSFWRNPLDQAEEMGGGRLCCVLNTSEAHMVKTRWIFDLLVFAELGNWRPAMPEPMG